MVRNRLLIEPEVRSEVSFLFDMVDKSFPHQIFKESLWISDDEKEVARSRDGDVHPALINQKAKRSLLRWEYVGTYAVEDHDVFLSALKGVDCIYLDIAELWTDWSQPRAECVFEGLHLGFVRRYDRDFAG